MHPLDYDGLVWRRLEEVGSLGNSQSQTTAHWALQQRDASQFDIDNFNAKWHKMEQYWVGRKHA